MFFKKQKKKKILWQTEWPRTIECERHMMQKHTSCMHTDVMLMWKRDTNEKRKESNEKRHRKNENEEMTLDLNSHPWNRACCLVVYDDEKYEEGLSDFKGWLTCKKNYFFIHNKRLLPLSWNFIEKNPDSDFRKFVIFWDPDLETLI